MFARKVNVAITPIAEAYEDWKRIWMGSREIQRFLAYTGLTAPPYNLRVENFLRFPHLRGMTAGRLMQKLRKLGVCWSADSVRRGVLQSVGYKLREIEEFEHNRTFVKKEVGAHV